MAESKWRVTIEPERGVFYGMDSNADDPVDAMMLGRSRFAARYPDQAHRLEVATYRIERVHKSLEETGVQPL